MLLPNYYLVGGDYKQKKPHSQEGDYGAKSSYDFTEEEEHDELALLMIYYLFSYICQNKNEKIE